MAFKAVLFVCASALLVQSISGRGCGCSCGCVDICNSGGDLQVTSVGPISPSGISVQSQLDLCGDLDVNGELPFLSAVRFDGSYDTRGCGCVDYSCGTCGNVAITSETRGSGCGCGSGCGRSSGCGCRSGCGCSSGCGCRSGCGCGSGCGCSSGCGCGGR